MTFTKTKIPEVVIIEPKVHGDDRGYFVETFRQDKLEEFIGYKIDFCQDNESKSSKGVLRGLHYQLAPAAQTKLVRAVVTDTNADYIEYEKIDWATTCDSDITFTNTYTGGNDIILSDEADNGQKICFHAEDLAWNPTYVATSIVSNLSKRGPGIL